MKNLRKLTDLFSKGQITESELSIVLANWPEARACFATFYPFLGKGAVKIIVESFQNAA